MQTNSTRLRLFFQLLIVNWRLLTSHGGIMISLAGKAALITGGSRGIGAAAVKLFAQAGADLIFNYNKAKDAALQIPQEAGKHSPPLEGCKCDLAHHPDNEKIAYP